MEKGKLVIMGEIETVEHDGTQMHPMALLITFKTKEEIRQAIADGKCEFNFGDNE